MVGLPGVGKTTRACELEEEHQAIRFTPDEWIRPLFGEENPTAARDILEGRFVWLARRLLSQGTSVVLDFGVWSREERSALRSLAADCRARFELHFLTIDRDEQWRRVAARQGDAPLTTFPITQADLDSYEEVFHEPDADEFDGTAQDSPPKGFPTWNTWMADRWPTSQGVV